MIDRRGREELDRKPNLIRSNDEIPEMNPSCNQERKQRRLGPPLYSNLVERPDSEVRMNSLRSLAASS